MLKRVLGPAALVAILFAASALAATDYGNTPILYGMAPVQGEAAIAGDLIVGEGIIINATTWDGDPYPEGFVVWIEDAVSEANLRARLLAQGVERVDLTRLVDPLIAEMFADELPDRLRLEEPGTVIPDVIVSFAIDGVIAVVDEQFVFEGTIHAEIDGRDFFVGRERNLHLEPMFFGAFCEDLENCEWSWYRCVKPGGGDCGVFQVFGIEYHGVCEFHTLRGGCVCCPGSQIE